MMKQKSLELWLIASFGEKTLKKGKTHYNTILNVCETNVSDNCQNSGALDHIQICISARGCGHL